MASASFLPGTRLSPAASHTACREEGRCVPPTRGEWARATSWGQSHHVRHMQFRTDRPLLPVVHGRLCQDGLLGAGFTLRVRTQHDFSRWLRPSQPWPLGLSQGLLVPLAQPRCPLAFWHFLALQDAAGPSSMFLPRSRNQPVLQEPRGPSREEALETKSWVLGVPLGSESLEHSASCRPAVPRAQGSAAQSSARAG